MHLRYVEFYAGVGGWTMALQRAVTEVNKVFLELITVECCAALDHSDLCNSVYQHNHSSTPLHGNSSDENRNSTATSSSHKNNIKARPIEKLTVQDLMNWNADLWMMSPPCQPHTRQHTNQENDLADSRSHSFLHICKLLQDLEPLSAKPSMLLLENVVGFESSKSCQIWIQTLIRCNYRIAQFHLQPTQIGVPNNRPRYYCVAIQRDALLRGQQQHPVVHAWIERLFSRIPTTTVVAPSSNLTANSAIVAPLEQSNMIIHTSLEELGVLPEETVAYDNLPELRTYLETEDAVSDTLRVPENVLQRPAAWCLDIVTPFSRRTTCFTSAYGKYVKGTGSVLLEPRNCHSGNESSDDTSVGTYQRLHQKYQLVAAEHRQYDPNWVSDLTESGYYLRYFSGKELSRLFGFSEHFTFPASVTTKQQWKLIGNSLNVHVASKMVELGLRAVRCETA